MNENDKYIFELTIKVRDYEVDVEGIVNNANYLHYLEMTRHEFCEMAGLSFAKMHEMGWAPVLRKAEIEYITPLRMGDTMVSKLALQRDGARFIFIQDIYKQDSSPVIKAVTTCVCLENGRLSRGDKLAEVFKKYL